MKFGLILLFCCVLTMAAPPQVTEPLLEKQCEWPDAPRAASTTTWGGGAGLVQGFGISMRHWFQTEGVQVNLLPIVNLNRDYKEVIFSLGVSHLHRLWEGRMYEVLGFPSRNLVYSYVGGHFMYSLYEDQHSDYWSDNQLETQFGAGGGLGLQMNWGAVQLSLGLGAQGNRNYSRHNYSREEAGYGWLISPSGEISAGYTFGWFSSQK